MPRPGQRSYECVRRAWHSDRHQPMRGSLIQEIFRIAHETHSPSTKKNKEWLEKLPIVVLRVEEIIYSKANSQEEYMDPKTLRGRVNDAIDTIIRRDEGTETGLFLQPCIEAALNLGCIARRASRSQRNTDPKFYLGAYSLGTFFHNPPNYVTSLSEEGIPNPTSSSPLAFQYSNFLMKPASSGYSERESSKGGSVLSNSFSSYPLFYGSYPPKPASDGNKECVEMCIAENSFPRDKKSSLTRVTITKNDDKPVNDFLRDPTELVVYDLSLRLAPLSVSASSQPYSPGDDSEGVGSNVASLSQEINAKFGELALVKKHKEFPLSSLGDLVAAPLDRSSGIRKRRAFEPAEGNKHFLWKPKLLCSRGAKV